MGTISEKIELLGKNIYTDIPSTLTLKAMPTSSELDYVSADEFDEVMINKILPISVEEQIDFGQLLEADYRWVCRGLRMLNYGYYITANRIFCPKCSTPHDGEYIVDIRSVGCKPIPEDCTGRFKISKDEFIDFNKDIEIKLLTISEYLKAQKDEYFRVAKANKIDATLATICYSIVSIGGEPMMPIETKMRIQNGMSSADYRILRDLINEYTDFGLRAGGTTTCPVCGSNEAAFIALTDDRFFRPTLGELRAWKLDKNREREEGNS